MFAFTPTSWTIEKYIVKYTLNLRAFLLGDLKVRMAFHDPDAEYVASQLEKIHKILSDMEHHLQESHSQQHQPAFDPEYHPKPASAGWSMSAPIYTKPIAQPAPVIGGGNGTTAMSPRRQEHLSMLAEMKVGLANTTVRVRQGSFFKSRRNRWLVRSAVALLVVGFIVVACLIGSWIWNLTHFHH